MTEYRTVVARQRQRQALAENREKLSRRKGIVERSFAEIKQHMGLRRWTYRGLRGTNTQWALMCTAYNLRKLFPHWVSGSLQLAAEEAAFFGLSLQSHIFGNFRISKPLECGILRQSLTPLAISFRPVGAPEVILRSEV